MKGSRLLKKVLVGEVMLFAVIAVVTSAMAGYTLNDRLTNEFTSKGTAIATAIANASNELIVTRDASTIQSLVDQFKQITGVGYVLVIDGDGTIVSHTFVPAVPPELAALRTEQWNPAGGDAMRQQEIRVTGGGDYIDLAAPILAGVAGSVHVGMDRNVIRADIRSAMVKQILVVIALFVMAVAVAFVVVGRISGPLTELTTHANRMATQDFEAGFMQDPALERLKAGRDEIGELAGGFAAMERAIGGYIGKLRQLAGELAHYNETLEETVATRTRELQEKNRALEATLEELKQAQDQIMRQEKMASLGALTAGIAHEIKNPLNFVNNFADLSRELAGEVREDLAKAQGLDPKLAADIDETLDQLQLNLSKIKEHGERADGIVRSMLLHSRGTAGQRAPTDINAIARDAVNLAYHGMRALDQNFQVGIDMEFDPSIGQVDAIPQDLMRAFLNIANNGCYAAYHRASRNGDEGGPRIGVKTRLVGDAVEIRIRDTGDGIPDEVRQKIFEPFFTTKPAGQGTGLGLSICHDIIVQQHRGTLAVESERGRFTEFIMTIPRGKSTHVSD
jgi:signal transduction histidine kinase